MKIKTIEDLAKFKAMGKTREPTGEPYIYKVFYRYELEDLDPVFTFLGKILSEEHYREKKGTKK